MSRRKHLGKKKNMTQFPVLHARSAGFLDPTEYLRGRPSLATKLRPGPGAGCLGGPIGPTIPPAPTRAAHRIPATTAPAVGRANPAGKMTGGWRLKQTELTHGGQQKPRRRPKMI